MIRGTVCTSRGWSCKNVESHCTYQRGAGAGREKGRSLERKKKQKRKKEGGKGKERSMERRKEGAEPNKIGGVRTKVTLPGQ